MVNVQELYNNLLEAAKNGNLAQVEALLQNKELSEEMIAAEENKVLKTAILNCPLPSVARFRKTNHLEVIERLLQLEEVKKCLRMRHHIHPEINQALDANDPEAIIQIIKEEALRDAAKSGNQAEVNKWLREITPSNGAAANAIQYAARGGHIEILKSILREVDERDRPAILNDFFEILHIAIMNGHFEVVDHLLRQDVIVNTLSFKHLSAACQKNHLPIVNRLLQEKSIREIMTSDDNWACRYSSFQPHFSLLDRLLQEAPARQIIHANQHEAFEKAVENRDLAMIYRIALEYPRAKEITEAGEPSFKDINDQKDLQTFLQMEGYPDLETFMREYLPRLKEAFDKLDKEGKESSPIAEAYRNLKPYYLLWAAEYGQLAQLEEYLNEEMGDRYLDLNHYRYKMLKLAAQNGHHEVINRLLQIPDFQRSLAENSVNTNQILKMAIINKHLPVVDRLLQEEVFNKNKPLPILTLRFAVETGLLEMVELILQQKNVRKAALNNCALAMAAHRGYINIMRRLLEEPEIRNHPHFSRPIPTLEEVVKRGDLAALVLLLELEPIRNVIANDEHKILRLAVTKNHLDLAYRIAIEYQKQGIDFPVEHLSQEEFNNVLLENGYADFDTFVKEYPAKVKLEHDTSLAMRSSLEDFLPPVIADIGLGYAEAPEVNIYRILNPYFQMQMQVRESRDKLAQQIEQGHALKRKGAKGESGAAAAAD